MKTFLLDLAHDLREKRLWPVAAVLLLALVAIPVVLMKPAKEPTSSETSASTSTAPVTKIPGLAKLGLADAATKGGSTLEVFASKNPFLPPKAVLAAKANEAGSTASSASSTAGQQEKSGGGSSGSEGSSGGSGGTTTPDGGSTSPKSPQRSYTYVADVRFGRSGHLTTFNGLRRLEMLPNNKDPLLIFLGADADGGNAVFLVDSTLKATGEGHCAPSGSECATLSIGPGAEHEFIDPDGRSYTLLIRQIRRVNVKSVAASRASASVAARRGGGRGFEAPILADIVTADLTGGDSSAGDNGR